MAVRRSGRSIATAIGAAAGAGAAQLGLGYGLGIVAWLPGDGPGQGAGDAAWLASLTWAVWIAATSAVAGAICAERLTGAPTALTTIVRRAALAVAAAVGALITVVLVSVPARSATPPDTSSPQMVAAGFAVTGVALGLAVAFWALSSRAVAVNAIATIAWLWLLAILTVIDGVASGHKLASAQLGVWQISSDSEHLWLRDYLYWPGAVLSLGSAGVIGALAARLPARRPETRVGAAVSGVAGPLLVAAAYFVAAPRLADIHAGQLSAHLMAPYAALAGLAGSVLVAALAQRTESRARLAGAVAPPSGDATTPSSDAAASAGDAATPADAAAASAGAVATASDTAERPEAAKPVVVPAQPSGAEPRSAGSDDGLGNDDLADEVGNPDESKRKPRRLGRRSR